MAKAKEPILWYHKKYKRSFIGKYELDSRGQRIFTLEGYEARLKYNHIVFESHQAAKKLGWYRK